MAHILIIDDDEAIREVLGEFLELEGFTIGIASNGQLGLEYIRQKPVDVVITDMEMPVMGGLNVIAEVCRDFDDVKIIAMSGSCTIANNADILEEARTLGADACIRKPFSLAEILAVVRELASEEDSQRGNP